METHGYIHVYAEFFKTIYFFYKNIDNNNNFIISNTSHPSYNFDEYIVCQELYNFKGTNVSYYNSFIKSKLFDNSLSVKREEIYYNITL